MKKFLMHVVLGILLLSFGGAIYVYRSLNVMQHVQITDDLYMVSGQGGNVAVLRTDEGTVLVDTMSFEMQGKKLRKIAEKLTGQPVVMVINSHYHLDHSHGNTAFDADIRYLATSNTLAHLKEKDSKHWQGDAAEHLPNELVDRAKTIRIGGKTLQLMHPGRGHTDGDLTVLFVEDKTLATGDLFFNRYYPNIDLAAGGSVQRWGASIGKTLILPFEFVIPGHGEVSDREGLEQFRAFIDQLAALARTAAKNGWNLQKTNEQALENDLFTEDAGYREIKLILPLGLNRDFVIGKAWLEATGGAKDSDAATGAEPSGG